MTSMNTTIRKKRAGAWRHRSFAAVAVAVVAFAACDMDIVNTNAPTVEELTDSPTRSTMARAAAGIFAQAYNNIGTEIQFYGIYGREGYNLTGNDPRETGEQVAGPRVPSGRNGGIWLGPYSAIRTINTYLTALPDASGLSDAERRASAGFAKTIKAWQMHRLAVRTGELGIPLEVDRAIDEEPAPIVSFEEAMAEASRLMDEARDDLEAGSGVEFPFNVAPGFDGFGSPANFMEFNRALAAKILVHRATFVDCTGCWTEAATALGESFVTDGGLPESLADGVYYAYSSASGEPANPISEPIDNNRFWVHSSIVTGAQLKADDDPDDRLTSKVMDSGREQEYDGLTGTHKPVLYNSSTDPTVADLGADIPWITNEELLLVRAEVRWNTGDPAGAIADIDRVRQHAGGLPASSLAVGSAGEDFVDELLYNRLYSLMWSQGTRWIDARRYDRLDELPNDRPGDQIFENMLIPANECVARGLQSTPSGCTGG